MGKKKSQLSGICSKSILGICFKSIFIGYEMFVYGEKKSLNFSYQMFVYGEKKEIPNFSY